MIYNKFQIFDTINLLKEEIKAVFPYKVIEIEGAEADDVIATLAEWSQSNNLVQEGLLERPEPFLIISGDHDFIQLQKYSNVKQFSPVHKKLIKPETSAEKYVIEHIIRGDKGDGVPNVLSSDDSIVTGERQKKIMQKKLDEWIDNPDKMPKDETFRRNYDRNKMLVDLSSIPQPLKDKIINTFETTAVGDRSKILDYFVINKMKMMMEFIGDF